MVPGLLNCSPKFREGDGKFVGDKVVTVINQSNVLHLWLFFRVVFVGLDGVATALGAPPRHLGWPLRVPLNVLEIGCVDRL